MKVVYWSSTGITRRLAEEFGGIPLDEYTGGDYLLVIPSYGAPRTGNHVPPRVKRFLREHGDGLVAVVGVGNTTFGSEFCLGARKVADRWGVPLLATVDVVATAEETAVVHEFLRSHRSKSSDT